MVVYDANLNRICRCFKLNAKLTCVKVIKTHVELDSAHDVLFDGRFNTWTSIVAVGTIDGNTLLLDCGSFDRSEISSVQIFSLTIVNWDWEEALDWTPSVAVRITYFEDDTPTSSSGTDSTRSAVSCIGYENYSPILAVGYASGTFQLYSLKNGNLL